MTGFCSTVVVRYRCNSAQLPNFHLDSSSGKSIPIILTGFRASGCTSCENASGASTDASADNAPRSKTRKSIFCEPMSNRESFKLPFLGAFQAWAYTWWKVGGPCSPQKPSDGTIRGNWMPLLLQNFCTSGLGRETRESSQTLGSGKWRRNIGSWCSSFNIVADTDERVYLSSCRTTSSQRNTGPVKSVVWSI